MVTDGKSRRPDQRQAEPSDQLVADPSASFTYELATKAPTKDVASVKAASDVFDANGGGRKARTSRSRDRATADVDN